MIDNGKSFQKENYRNELDGLRAFALIGVIINHFSENLLPSGFLGVDIFFVLSGFVITCSLDSKRDQFDNIFSFFINFYWRRIVRILPALLFYVFTISILISLFNPAPQKFIISGLTSLFGISNLYFFQQTTDYFSNYVDLNPFLHTWSLGIELQFYFFFPFILFLSGYLNNLRNSQKNLFFLNLFFFSSSLISFFILYITNESASYFLTSSRIWEISAGSITYIGISKRLPLFEKLKRLDSFTVILIITFIFICPVELRWISTFLIVVLTSIFIICIKKQDLFYKIFAYKLATFIGKISYSLYLWHWGILTISRWTIGIFWWTIPFQIILILIFGILSYKLIEKPFKTNIFLNKGLNGFFVIFLSYAGSITLIIFGTLTLVNQMIFFTGIQKEFGVLNYPKKGYKKTLINKTGKNIYIFGDSFAGHFISLFEKISLEKKYNIFLHTLREGFEKDITKEGNYKYLYYSLKDYSSEIKEEDILFISLGQIDEIKFDSKKEDFIMLINLIDELKIRTIFFGPTPRFREGLYAICQKEWFRPDFAIKEECSPYPREKILNDLEFYSIFLDKLTKESENIFILNAFDILCPEEYIYCPLKKDNQYIYSDEHHLTEFGSFLLENEVNNFLGSK